VTSYVAYRRFWNPVSFWITFALLVAAQVPLVIAVRPFVEQYRFPLMLAFAVLDCVLVAVVMSWAASKGGSTRN
jgi:hypothetical protein